MKLKSLALAVSIISMLILALSSPFLFSQTKAQNQKDPSIIMRCIFASGQSSKSCSFTSNTPPSGSQVLIVVFYYTASVGSCSGDIGTGWTQIINTYGERACYQLFSSATSFSWTCTNGWICAVAEIDYITGTLSINGYSNSCAGGNSAGTTKWMAIYGSACGVDTQMLSTSVWLFYQVWYNPSGNVQCYDSYCSLWTPSVLSGYTPIVVGSAGPNNNGWTGSQINGNISANVASGGGPQCPNNQQNCLYNPLLVQAGPVSLGGNNNGAMTTTISLTQTQTNFVAPSPTSVQYWIIPMFLILGVGALLLMIGRYAGMTGGDTFMLFVLGAWLGSIFGLMANIVPIAIVIVISIVMIFMIWRKVS